MKIEVIFRIKTAQYYCYWEILVYSNTLLDGNTNLLESYFGG